MERSLSVSQRRKPWWMAPFTEPSRDLWFDRMWPEWPASGEEYTPRMDFFEKDGKYIIKADLPGMDKEDISIDIEKDTVTISGKKESDKEESNANYYLKESSYGYFSRSFRLPSPVDESKVDASFKNGILKLEMPQKEGGKARKIQIKS
jgi:HSP20 family protein